VVAIAGPRRSERNFRAFMASTAIHPPGPGRLRSLSPLFSMCTDRISPVVECFERYGNVVLLQGLDGPLYLFNEPEVVHELLAASHRDVRKDTGHQLFLRPILRNGLLLAEGEDHRKQRRMMQPAFHSGRIAAYGDTMATFAARMATRWREGQVIDALGEMMDLALDIVGKTLFNSEIAEDKRAIASAIDDLLRADAILLKPFGHQVMRLPIPPARRFWKALASLDAIVYRIIREHREAGGEGDLLDMLMAARDEVDGGAMSDGELRDEVLTLFLAGHETTATTMTWAWRLIAEHPEVEARFHAEIDGALGGRTPAMEDVERLPWTRQIVEETLRLYPPAYFYGREALRELELLGYAIPAGAQVLLSPYYTHRDPRFFPEPERFDPERFSPERRESRPRNAYFPFGAGPRKCIGERFALMEAVLVLATIGQRWRLGVDDTLRPEIDPKITLRPRGGMPLVVIGR